MGGHGGDRAGRGAAASVLSHLRGEVTVAAVGDAVDACDFDRVGSLLQNDLSSLVAGAILLKQAPHGAGGGAGGGASGGAGGAVRGAARNFGYAVDRDAK